MAARRRRRSPFAVDPDVPSSIDVINAFAGGGPVVRNRFAAPGSGPSPFVAGLGVVLVLVGGWLVLSAVTLRRVQLDDLPVVPRSAKQGGSVQVLGPVDHDRSVVVAHPDVRPPLPGRATPLPAPEGAAVPGCDWLPAMAEGSFAVERTACVPVRAGEPLRLFVGAAGDRILDPDDLPTRVNIAYLVQGLVPAAIGSALLAWWAVLARRHRSRLARYVAEVEAAMAPPVPSDAGPGAAPS